MKEPKTELIDRPEYMRQLKLWHGQDDLVKIVTGVRRCGKSKLFELFQSYLKSTFITDKQIIKVNLEDEKETKKIGLILNKQTKLLDEYGDLLDYILRKIVKGKKNYIFIDEIQMLDNWQRVANTLRLQKNVEVYLTGSNAYMFSSDLANTFGGRYIEIKMKPLSFKEYASAFSLKTDELDLVKLYEKYVSESSFPQSLSFEGNQEMIKSYLLDAVYRNTVQKDIVQRFKIADTLRLDDIIKFLFDNIGNETSLRNIQSELFNKIGLEISSATLNTYVKGILDSYLMYKCERYDIKGKRILGADAKYYASDIGLRNAITSREGSDAGRSLENIVYLELLNRNYQVSTGKVKTKQITINGKKENKTIEVDFVAKKRDGMIEYYQIAWTVLGDTSKTLDRELASLEEIKDHYPKFLITMDYGSSIHNGIRRLNAINWLMGISN